MNPSVLQVLYARLVESVDRAKTECLDLNDDVHLDRLERALLAALEEHTDRRLAFIKDMAAVINTEVAAAEEYNRLATKRRERRARNKQMRIARVLEEDPLDSVVDWYRVLDRDGRRARLTDTRGAKREQRRGGSSYKKKSMVDVGCGTGGMVALSIELGLKGFGIDGDADVPKDTSQIAIHDFHNGPPLLSPGQEWDVCYTCEFLEHVDEACLPNVFKVFEKCKWVVMTAAPLGWGGHHHVNENDHEYWIRVFNSHGFYHVPSLTREAREASTMNVSKPKAKQFISHRGLVFANVRKCEVWETPEKLLFDRKYDSPKLPFYVERRDYVNDAVRLFDGKYFRSTVPLVGLITEPY